MDFLLVQHAEVWPNCCALCQSQKGPLLDSKISYGRTGDRMYFCALCVRLMARELGLIKGERHTELLKAGESLEVAAIEVSTRQTIIDQQNAELAARTRKIEALEELLQQARDTAATQRHQLETIAETSKSMLQMAS